MIDSTKCIFIQRKVLVKYTKLFNLLKFLFKTIKYLVEINRNVGRLYIKAFI